jgi:undecaprenyl-phosphate 4-deoxy-4-formamido-L-arabinose transferase
VHDLAIIIPVYGGASTLPKLLDEIIPLTEECRTPRGRRFRVTEVYLVNDNGAASSDETIRKLAATHDVVRPVWLSRNYGQHAATLAGMASSTAPWIVTMDEDGQHDPAAIARMLDVALDEQRMLVYAAPTNPPPHGRFRNTTSAVVKGLATRVLVKGELGRYHSFRLMVGEIGRSVAAYCGEGVFLDVALSWVVERPASCPVAMRVEGSRRSGYGLRRLLSHFWRLVLTSGTQPLRVISLIGSAVAAVGFLTAGYVIFKRLTQDVQVEGWTSVIITVLVTTGVALFSLGVIAEYLGAAVRMAMGKPQYLIVTDPRSGPLGHDEVDDEADDAPSKPA